jgi:hypothetical protein
LELVLPKFKNQKRRKTMAINLQEIRTAVISYVDTKVTVSVSTIAPVTGASIGPNEEFSFTLTAKNADSASGGIALKDIIWRVWVQNDVVGKLIVPAAPMVARSGLSSSSAALTPGTQVREMYLFPPTASGNYLHVGDTDTLSLKGKAGAAPAGGITNIQFKIYADVDMDWLFPKDQDSSTYTRELKVFG